MLVAGPSRGFKNMLPFFPYKEIGMVSIVQGRDGGSKRPSSLLWLAQPAGAEPGFERRPL